MKILIITKERNNVAKKLDDIVIEVEGTENIKEILNRLDNDLYDSYDFVVFKEKQMDYIYIGHYLPLNLLEDCKNQVFVNELLLNNVIISNLTYLINESYKISVGIMLKHILRKDGKIENFCFDSEINYISDFNKFTKKDSQKLKNDIYDAVEENYCQNSILRHINFKINKDKIVKTFLFKVYNNIIEDIKKNTNINLVFKKLICIIK